MSVTTVASAVRGFDALKTNIAINHYTNNNDLQNAAIALRTQYGFGGKSEKDQFKNILNGNTILKAGNGDGNAQTVAENGKRTVYLNGYSNDMPREEQLKLGITLGHESYRDGIKGDELTQKIETRNAVAGHTDLMVGMLADDMYKSMMSGIIAGDTNLQMDLLARSLGDKVFNDYVDNCYDSSADYWKFTKDGNIVWDGENNLYDEDGKILHVFSGNGGHTAALAEGLGITEAEARQMLVEAKYTWDSNKKTFVDNNGNDVKNVTSKAAITNNSVKDRYDFQHNYIGKVFEKYNGSMQNALQAYVAKQLTPYEGCWDTPMSTDQLAGSMMIASEYFEFAQKYDEAMIKYGNVGSNNITQEIYDNIYNQTGWQSNDNILYDYIENGTVRPVVGASYITTYAFYGPGLESYGINEGDMHSTSVNGTAADLGTNQQNLPVVSVFNSSFLINNSYGYTSGGGNFISLYTNNLKNDYKHLLGSSNAYSTMHTLNSYGHNAGIWSFPVPSNYQIGNVGNSGTLSSGVHLHFQNTRWR